MLVTIYHNNQCSKSRATLEILKQTPDATIQTIDYLNSPPSADALATLSILLGKSAQQMMRHNESIYQELDLASTHYTEAELFQIMHENPKLIERPIVVVDQQKAIIARPPELVLGIL